MIAIRTRYFVFVAIFAAAFAARGDTLTFSASINGEMRDIVLNSVIVGGRACVSLKELAGLLGGEMKIADNRVQVDMLNGTANLIVGETHVATTANEFTLEHAPQVNDNDVVIAASDVIGFLKYGFKSTSANAAAADGTKPVISNAPGRKLRVVIDAGHGGQDAGKEGRAGAQEKQLAFAIAQKVAKLLEPVCQPIPTRTQDVSMTMPDRVTLANVTARGDLLISIHAGTSLSAVPSGFEIFCPVNETGAGQPQVDRSLALGRSLSNAIATATGTPARGVRQAPCRIFTNLQMPAVLIEVGFVTNPAEEQLLNNAEYQDKLAQGIATGIGEYIKGTSPAP